jgi:hypothetical protein
MTTGFPADRYRSRTTFSRQIGDARERKPLLRAAQMDEWLKLAGKTKRMPLLAGVPCVSREADGILLLDGGSILGARRPEW